MGNNSLPGEYFIYLLLKCGQQAAQRYGWKCTIEEGCERTMSTRHLILHTTDFKQAGAAKSFLNQEDWEWEQVPQPVNVNGG